MSAADRDELYGDLDSAPLAKKSKSCVDPAATSGSSTQAKSAAAPLGPLSLHGIGKVYDEAHIAGMQEQIDALKAENETLKRNIGTLYRTAKVELARKDETIMRLQDQIDGGSTSKLS